MTDRPSDTADTSGSADACDAVESTTSLTSDQLELLEDILEDLRQRSDEVPQWEFCDGFLTALVCSRRAISAGEYLPMLLGDGEPVEVADGQPLPLLPMFADAAQQAQFLQLWQLRWNQVELALDTPVERLDDERTFEPEVLDMRGAIASLSDEERAEMSGEDIPSFAQVWALGFMFAVENWPQDWEMPRDKEVAGWLDSALECIVALTEDDTGKPEVSMYSDDGAPTTSTARVDAFGAAIWAVYDLRQLWKSLGPRVESLRKAPEPGRNDPCTCGSGKKYKKCCGA